LQRVVARY